MSVLKVIILLQVLLSPVLYAGDVIRSAAVPQEVTLYLRGAKVMTKTSVNLQKGRNKVLIQNLPASIDDNSYKIGVDKGVSLISFSPNYKNTGSAPIESSLYSKEIIDSVYAGLDQRIQDARSEIEQNNIQLEFIKDVISNNKQLDKSDSKKGEDGKSAFVRNLTGLIQIYEAKSDFYIKENRKWKAEVFRLEKEKGRWTATFYPKPQAIPIDLKAGLLTKQLVIELVSAQTRTTEIEISYFVSQASWIPSYDLKVTDIAKPMEIVYKGKVYQNTGQDWDGVRLSVSAFMPRPHQDRPVLSHLYVNYQLAQSIQATAGYDSRLSQKRLIPESKDNRARFASNTAMDYKQGAEEEYEADYDIPVAQVSQEQLNVVYRLESDQTIFSDSAGSTIILATQTADMNARYYWIPRQTNDVYLIAWLKNWDDYHFLDGEASIFLNDNFVGKTRINTRISGEEFPISLGVDDRVIAKRSEIQDKNKISTRKELRMELHQYELSVRNNTPAALQIDVYDQFPVSESDKVKVENLVYGTAKYIAESGSLHWDLKVGKGSLEKVSMAYSMSYPLDGGLNYYNR